MGTVKAYKKVFNTYKEAATWLGSFQTQSDMHSDVFDWVDEIIDPN